MEEQLRRGRERLVERGLMAAADGAPLAAPTAANMQVRRKGGGGRVGGEGRGGEGCHDMCHAGTA